MKRRRPYEAQLEGLFAGYDKDYTRLLSCEETALAHENLDQKHGEAYSGYKLLTIKLRVERKA